MYVVQFQLFFAPNLFQTSKHSIAWSLLRLAPIIYPLMPSHHHTHTHAYLPWVYHHGNMNVLSGGKLPELCNGLVLHGVAVVDLIVGAQHELEVVHNHMLYVVNVGRMRHGLGEGERGTCERREEGWKGGLGDRWGQKVHSQPTPIYPYLNNRYDIHCSIETHKVHRQLLKLVCPILILVDVPLQI